MAEIVALVGPMIAAGYILRRVGLVRGEVASDLSTIVFYFTLPPLIFQALHRAELAWSFLLMPAAAWGMVLFGAGAGLVLTRFLRRPGPEAGALIIVTVFGNTTFFGYPIVRGFYGETGLTLAIFYDLLGASMAANTVALAIASLLGSGRRVRAAQVARQIALFPPIWGMILGLSLRWLSVPAILSVALDSIGNLTAPLIMLSIGLSLKLGAWREELPLVAAAAAGRLLLMPLVAWLLLSALGFPPELLRVAVMQSAMPTMFFSLTLALLFGLHKEIVVNAIMLSTLLSFATLPGWHYFLSAVT